MVVVGRHGLAALDGKNARHPVAAGRDEARAVAGESDRLHPVRVLFPKARLLSARGVEEADGAVAAAGREQRSIGTESHAQRGVRQVREQAHLPACGGVDEKHAAPLRRRAARDGDAVRFRIPRERGDALRQPADAPHERAGVGVPERDFVVAAGGELRAVGAESERGDGRGTRVLFRRGQEQRFADEFRERAVRRAAVIGRAFLDPTLDQRNLGCGERVGFLRHAVIRVPPDESRVDVRCVRFFRDQRGCVAVARFAHPLERIQPVTALRILLAVTRRAPPVQHGCDFPAKAHGLRRARGE